VDLTELQHGLEILAVLVAIAGVLRFEMFCLDDVLHAPYVRTLPRETWIALCVLTIPLGGILYLYYGRPRF
jgi:hypothetical protein